MGLFKQMKDLNATVKAAPGMIEQANQMAAQAQQMQAAYAAQQQAAYAQAQAWPPPQATAPAGGGVDPAWLAPVAGVTIELFAHICKGLAAYNYDQSKAPLVASQNGVAPENWQAAVDGWNERIRLNPAVAQHFNRLYTGR